MRPAVRPPTTVDEPETEAPQQSAHRPAPNSSVRPKRNQLKKSSRHAILPVAAALLAAFVAATGYLIVKEPPVTNEAGRWTGTPGLQSPEPAPFALRAESTADPFDATDMTLTGLPTWLKVSAIGLDTPLEALRIGADGALTPPKDFDKAGWFADGTRPGDVGPAVIAGHVDSRRGKAVFYDLRKLIKGDRIDVVRGGRTVRFRVFSTEWYPKTMFPTNKVYGPTPDRQLRLITCGGVFDHRLRSYKDNLVVYAVAG